MADLLSSLEDAIDSAEKQRKALNKRKARQVSASDERALLKANALAWFNSHRPYLKVLNDDALLKSIDASFQQLLEFSDKATSRTKCREHLKALKADLVKLRSQAVLRVNTGEIPTGAPDQPPDFPKLISDSAMIAILKRRWQEAQICRDAPAPLAAIVMMGSLLEALLLARANRLDDKSVLFKAKSAPIDSATKKPLKLQQWTLRHYIDVAHELDWIGNSAKDVGETLRDYRNYIHPEKELKHNMHLTEQDARMFWVVFCALAEQVIDSV